MLYDSSSGEEGIWKVRLKKIRARLKETRGLRKEHESGIKYLDQRVGYLALYLLLIAVFIVLFTASSPYLTYGSMGLAILGTFLWGALRIKRILALKELRRTQARESAEGSQDNIDKPMQPNPAEPSR